MDWGGGKGSRAWRHAFNLTLPFHDTRFWYQSLIGQMSSFWQIRSAIDSIADVFQYHTLTIRENIFENTDFEQAIQIFLQAQDFSLIPRFQEEQEICLWTVGKRKQSIQNAGTSTFSYSLLWSTMVVFKKPWSHLKSRWLINKRSKDTTL